MPRPPSLSRWRLASALGLLVAAACLASPASAHEGESATIEALTRALEARPDDVSTRLERAALLRQRGELEAAHADLRVVERLEAGSAQLALERGLWREASGDLAGAERDLDRVVALDRGHVHSALLARARLRERRGDLGGAAGDLDRAWQLARLLDTALARGALAERRAELDRASEVYVDALSSLGESAPLRFALARVEARRGAVDRALGMLDQAARKAPQRATWWLVAAEICDEAKRGAKARDYRRRALAELDRSIKRRPTAQRLYQRALARAGLGQLRPAQADVRRALQLAPQFPEATALEADLGRRLVTKPLRR